MGIHFCYFSFDFIILKESKNTFKNV